MSQTWNKYKSLGIIVNYEEYNKCKIEKVKKKKSILKPGEL